MRIALVAPDLSGRSGWSRYAADLAAALRELGHHVSAAVASGVRDAPCPQAVLLPPWEACLGGGLGGGLAASLVRRRAAARLGRWLEESEPDVVHFVAEPYALLLPLLPGATGSTSRSGALSPEPGGLAKAGRLAPRPGGDPVRGGLAVGRSPRGWRSLVTLHGSYAVIPLAAGGATGALARSSFQALDRVVTVSEFTRRHLAGSFPDVHAELERLGKLSVVPNGIALPPPPAPRPPPGQGAPRRILGVGGVKARKGFVEAVEACGRFAEASPLSFRYDIVGSLEQSRGYPGRIRRRARELGLEDRVVLRGVLDEDELRRAYREADLFLLLSLQSRTKVEGFGLVFLEASAWGVPVIGPTTGGCPEAIAQERSGYVCDPHDPDEVARHMRLVLEEGAIDPAACRSWAEAHDVRGMAERLLEVYEG